MSAVTSNDMCELLIHDMRTPLATISGYVQLLQRRAATQSSDVHQLVGALEHIERAATRLRTLLDELAQLPDGSGEPRTEGVDLVDLVRRVSAEADAISRRRVVVLPSIPELIGEWNRRAIEHMVANLLENALKYSLDEQNVLVTVGCDGDYAVLEVIDDGIGIPPAEQGHVFERGYRASNVTARVRGTGLGLAGARQIAENHGGTITLRSELGAGTTLTVRLPRSRQGHVSRD
jgi:signal transduction histidine kinase